VADFFCGSGTLPVVAERLGRRWIACDASPRAIHTTTKRLLDAAHDAVHNAAREACAPFEVWSAAAREEPEAQVKADCHLRGRTLHVTLRDYEADVPDDLRPRVQSFQDLVDYWEIDLDYGGDVFCSQWQSFRSRGRELVTRATFEVDGRKEEQIAIRIVDVLGRTTTLTV
jgi:hypothetical protein